MNKELIEREAKKYDYNFNILKYGSWILGFTVYLIWIHIGIGVATSVAPQYLGDSTGKQEWFGGISGLKLSIDAKTGCHYLSTGGSIIKRTDKDGNHICVGSE